MKITNIKLTNKLTIDCKTNQTELTQLKKAKIDCISTQTELQIKIHELQITTPIIIRVWI